MSRKLDAAIAEALGWKDVRGVIFGQRRKDYRGKPPKCEWEEIVPKYSNDGNAMLELDAEMRKRGWLYIIHRHRYANDFYGKVVVQYFKPEDISMFEEGEEKLYSAIAKNETMARALAVYYALTGKEWVEPVNP